MRFVYKQRHAGSVARPGKITSASGIPSFTIFTWFYLRAPCSAGGPAPMIARSFVSTARLDAAMPVSRLLPGLLICASLLPAVRTWAEETTEVAAVTVTAVRDPGLMPYAKVDALRSALQQDTDPHDKVRVMFRVMDAKTQLPAKDVRINLWTNDAVYPVPLQDSFIALDELPHTNDPDAKFASNKRAGALELDLLLFAVLPDAQKNSPPPMLRPPSTRPMRSAKRSSRGICGPLFRALPDWKPAQPARRSIPWMANRGPRQWRPKPVVFRSMKWN